MKSINFYCDIILTSGNVEYLDPPVPPFYVTKNRMGKHSVVLQDELGYTYNNRYQKTNNPTVHTWRCSQRNARKCRTTCIVENDLIIMRRNPHNHMIKWN